MEPCWKRQLRLQEIKKMEVILNHTIEEWRTITLVVIVEIELGHKLEWIPKLRGIPLEECEMVWEIIKEAPELGHDDVATCIFYDLHGRWR